MKRPLPADLLDWFRAYMGQTSYMNANMDTGLSPNTIKAIMDTGTASAGVISHIERFRAGDVVPPETIAVRQLIARQTAARIIAAAAEEFPPEIRQRMIDMLTGPELDAMAVRNGALRPLGSKPDKKPSVSNI